MAKGTGLIGNFKGKVGNTVGYKLSASNNGQTQGIRVYQPIVKNPKTAAQAEQRAKLAPINATYRALKMIIDRGQESKSYGNRSRLAWLSEALRKFNGGWFEKGAQISCPALVPITRGSLAVNIPIIDHDGGCSISVEGATSAGTTKVGQLSTLLLAQYPTLQEGDQITFIVLGGNSNGFTPFIQSIVVDSTSTESLPNTLSVVDDDEIKFAPSSVNKADAIVVSREGSNGAHLRTSAMLNQATDYETDSLSDAAKEASIASYMATGLKIDWAEESIQ